MKISCPACAAKYSIADEKVQDRLAKIRCRKCSATIVIDGKATPPNVYAAENSGVDHANLTPSALSDAAREYSVDYGDNDQRTLSLAEVVTAYNRGEITAETFLWAEGMSDWQALGEIPEVVDALHSSTAQAAPVTRPGAAAVKATSPWEAPAQQVKPRQSDADVARAAARSHGDRASTADLFGSLGGDDEVATSAPRPDLSAATGARNESSVLFSLSALTASAKPVAAPAPGAKPASPGPSAPTKADEDSGLIDLRALTTASPQQNAAPAAPLMPSPLGIAPLGVEPLGLGSPFGTGVEAQVSPLSPPAPKSKTGLIIGIGIALAAVVILLAIVLRPDEPKPADPAVATPATNQPAQGTPTAAPTQEEPAAVTAKPPATGTAEEETAPPDAGSAATAKPTTRPRTTSRPSTRKPSGESPAAPAEKKPAVKRNPCGCATGDLQCAMRCAAGR